MKRFYTIIIIATGLLMSVACMKETLEPEQRVSGLFVLDGAAGGRDRYISFDRGVYVEMVARNLSSSYYYTDGKLWGCRQSDFSSGEKKQYAIIGGELVLDGVPQGKISQTGDNLLIGSKKYKLLKGLEKQYFFTISLPEGTSKTVTYSSQSVSIPYAVVSPSPASHARPTVTCDATWVKILNVSGDRVTFNMEENNAESSRSTTLLLRHPWADDVVVHLCQTELPLDLSATQSANCYIVSSAGAYSFRTTEGNGSTSVGSVSSAVVLWESYGTSTTPSVGSIINNVSYSSNTITFFTPSTLKNGNAVIAAKDASGNILWSWHIWVCKDYNPASSAQTYYNNAGTMMDRNLGATSATPGDVGALGLFYQWGRKDPFLGSSSISSSGTQASSTLNSWPSPVESTLSNGTIEYAVKNPTTFIKYNSNNFDWYYTGSSSTDNDRWKSTKTIYDPCPPGWRVPDGGRSGVWAKALNSNNQFAHDWDSRNKGMNFSGKFGSAGPIWYPAAGSLYCDDGSLYYVGYYGIWWSCTPSDYYAYYLDLRYDGYVDPSYYFYYRRAYGQSVRCVQE